MQIIHFHVLKHIFELTKTYLPVIFVYFIWCIGSIPITFTVIYPRFEEGKVGNVFVGLFYFSAVLTFYCLVKVSLSDPGVLTNKSLERYFRKFKAKDRPKCDFCQICNISKPERAHHCKRCGYCVLKMDHHCPWIKNCVGNGNQWLFQTLLFYTLLMAVLALYVIIKDYLLDPCAQQVCLPSIWYFQHRNTIKIMMIVVAVFVLVSCGFLLVAQFLNVKYDQTTMETMKAMARFRLTGEKVQLTIPSSVMESYAGVCGYENFLWWLFPCRTRKDVLIDDEMMELSKLPV